MLRLLYEWLREPLQSPWVMYADYVELGSNVILGKTSSVDVKYYPLHPGKCIEIGASSQIFGSLIVQQPDAYIKIGERTQIGASSLIAACGIEVGDDVLMAWNVVIMDNDSHSLKWEERKNDVIQCGIDYHQFPQDFARNKDWSHVLMAPIHIGNKAWIGFNVSILKGVTVGEGAVIGAGSVVTKDVSPYTVVAGNPARVIRSLE